MIPLLLVFIATLATIIVVTFSLLQLWLIAQFLSTKTVAAPVAEIENGQWPSVLIQLPIYNEGPIIEQLLSAVSKLDYPHDRLAIQVLDDSTDSTTSIAGAVVEKLHREQGLRITHLRRTTRDGFKAGALANGLAVDAGHSAFIAIFDADFTPSSNFLKRTIPLFQSEKLALVQTRWAHRNAKNTIFTRLMALALDNHFTIEQGGRQAAGCFINFNGTAGIWRRSAIESVGGWSADSLTEDLDLSFRAQIAGWTCQYTMDISTPSEIPAQLTDLRGQQFRWTKGSLEVARKLVLPLLHSKVPLRQKVVGVLHLTSGLQFATALLFGLAALGLHAYGTFPELNFYRILSVLMTIATVVFAFAFVVSQRALERQTLKTDAITILRAIAFTIFAIGFSVQNSWALGEAMIARKSEFVRTPKLGWKTLAPSRPNRFAILVAFEAALSLFFFVAAAQELIAWHIQFFPLFFILVTYGLGFSFMVVMSLMEKLPTHKSVSAVKIEENTAAAPPSERRKLAF